VWGRRRWGGSRALARVKVRQAKLVTFVKEAIELRIQRKCSI